MTGHDDGAPGAARRGVGPARSEEALLGRLQALAAEHAATPDEDFRTATRARLVAMAAVRSPAAARAPRRRTRLTAGLVAAALTLAALGGLLASAQGARPGDLLYGVKRGGEQTRLALAGDDRGLTLLGFATTRLDELGQLVGVQPHAAPVAGVVPAGSPVLAAGPDLDLVVDTLQTMDAQTAEGTAALTTTAVTHADTGALTVLTGWADAQQAGIDRLARAVPPGAEATLTAARDLAVRVAARGADLGRALGCPVGPSTGGTDELGPRPAPCPAEPAPPAAPPTAAGTTAPSTTAAVPATPSSAPTSAVPAVPTSAAPAPTSRTGQPLPSLPVPSRPAPSLPAPSLPVPTLPVPSLPLPSLPGGPAPSAPPGPVVSVPPVVPGVSVCLPPLITVGC
ncbi:putative Predicted protein [Modestobacter italicus]|uniref:DUF5667 domain-containing protein n=1 Tax=Modestobacter italicus (strain DSM 44449 / CECT 9708 / BC 501) TaxID=2732864 RepID=I4F417_MODI5|nr:hypothetical protein [Modestobacter marinus]CCH90380.1 putative Predicted protein [Modestobacter marinus]